MPTYERPAEFMRDVQRLTPEQRAQFEAAVRQFVEDLKAGERFRPSLRVKRFRSIAGYWEMTWASDGRALFEFGEPLVEGEAHIIWRRVGTHHIFRTS